jgi:uncharacterized protein (TIGR02757 family)
VKRLRKNELKDFLDEKVVLYNRSHFIENDPVAIPHRFKRKEDIEIAGFLSATIAWGQRPVILRNATALLSAMDNAPHDFILHYQNSDLLPFRKFVHRTFNGTDCLYYLKALRKIYKKKSSLENLFEENFDAHAHTDFSHAINAARNYFFSLPHEERTRKHFASPHEGSASKRINMFLRWMIRKDRHGVDFGIWKFNPALLTCPLDVHSARVARKLGLLKRKTNDWLAATELTTNLRAFDPADPVKYDFALFGLGVFEKF